MAVQIPAGICLDWNWIEAQSLSSFLIPNSSFLIHRSYASTETFTIA